MINSKEAKNEIISLTSGLSEVALDSLLSGGLFKDIPIIGSVISVCNLTRTAVDTLLLIRILKFIEALDVKSQKEIDELKEKYFKNEDYPRIGYKLLFSLEKIDDAVKIGWLAKTFRIFLDKKISQASFLRISTIINTAFVDDVEFLTKIKEKERITSTNELMDSYVLDHLYSIGLLGNIGIDGGDVSGNNSGNIFCLNEFGEIFVNELLAK